MSRRVDVEPDNVTQLRHELGVGGELKAADAVRLKAVSFPDALHRGDADAGRVGHGSSGPVGGLVRGSVAVRATTLSMTSWPSGLTRGGRVLSRKSPATPASAKRSCQRQTQVFDLPVRRMISTVPSPPAESSTISARQACF